MLIGVANIFCNKVHSVIKVLFSIYKTCFSIPQYNILFTLFFIVYNLSN